MVVRGLPGIRNAVVESPWGKGSVDRLKTLIHIHTDYSYDSDISLEALAAVMASERLGCVAVTDHDTIEGALRFRHLTDAKVIIGEEITTRDGHLIGLFLHEGIRPGMSAIDTAKAIRAQGGLVFVPHPFVTMFSCGLRHVTSRIVDLIDAVEVNNAQNILIGPDRRARHFAEEHRLVKYVGADSHMSGSVVPCYQVLRDFTGAEDFLDALATAELRPGRHPLGYFAATGTRLMRYYLSLALPGGFGTNAGATGLEVPGASAAEASPA